ncbi:MAG TPA: hypothetical protein PLZ75_12510 [Bacteroidales bacterium]|jgi:hypothetical protein|nr:hypothetical protein [Bacteroidales bacterium]
MVWQIITVPGPAVSEEVSDNRNRQPYRPEKKFYHELIMNGITAPYKNSDRKPCGEYITLPEGSFCPFHLSSNNFTMPLMPMGMLG